MKFIASQKDWFTEAPVDKYTKGLAKLIKEIAITAKKENKEYFFGGGFAIEFFVGKISRNHYDIDFHPMLKDTKFWLDWFKKKGYKVENPADPQFKETYKIMDKNGCDIVDMWPLKLEDKTLLIMMDGKYVDSWRHWEETRLINFQGTYVRIENPERILEQKTRHSKQNKTIRKQDQHDFHLLGKELKI